MTAKSTTGVKKLNLSGAPQEKLIGIDEQQHTTQPKQPAMRNPELATREEIPDFTWSGLLTRNRATTNGMSLDYIHPKLVEGNIVVKLDKEETYRETDK